MENLKYTMLIQWSEEEQLYLVHFPDFPQQHFITHGKSYPEAASNGQDALSGLIAVLKDNNQPIPEPSIALKPYPSELDDDDMPSEYDFTGNGVRGKFAKALQEHGYSITIHHEDGTSTTSYVSPEEVIEQQRQRERLKQDLVNQSLNADRAPNTET
jgi:predicted RNase H-like HicB family nuclease